MNKQANTKALRTLAEDVVLGVSLIAMVGLFLNVAVSLPL